MDTTKPQLVKGRDLIGLKVITLQEGEHIQDVDELVYDPIEDKVTALVVDKGGMFSGARVILFEDIKSIGKDAIIVETAAALKKASEVQRRITRIMKDKNFLTENNIITEDGTELGKISDIYFDKTTGKVVEFEVSQGLKNLESGKKRVRIADVIKIGKDATIVKSYVEEKLENQSQEQGLKGAWNRTKEETPGLLDQAKTALSNAAEKTQQKAREFGENAKASYKDARNDPDNQRRVEGLQNKTQQAMGTIAAKTAGIKDNIAQKVDEQKMKRQEDKKKEALGKYLTTNIISPFDETLAKRGDMVTHELLIRAEAIGMLDQVTNNTSVEPVTQTEVAPKPKAFDEQRTVYEITQKSGIYEDFNPNYQMGAKGGRSKTEDLE